MEQAQLLDLLRHYPDELGKALNTYKTAKRTVEGLEAQLTEENPWPLGGDQVKTEKYEAVEQQVSEAKIALDDAETSVVVLQARFEANQILARLLVPGSTDLS